MSKFIEFSNDTGKHIINLDNYSVRKYYIKSSMRTEYCITFTSYADKDNEVSVYFSNQNEWNKFYEEIRSVVWQG